MIEATARQTIEELNTAHQSIRRAHKNFTELEDMPLVKNLGDADLMLWRIRRKLETKLLQ